MREKLKAVVGVPCEKPEGFVRCLEEFEGSLVDQYRELDGSVYLRTWVDCDDETHRWLFSRVTGEAIEEYLDERVSLYLLIRNGDHHVLSDDPGQAVVVNFEDLPKSHLPSRTAYHDAALRPSNS